MTFVETFGGISILPSQVSFRAFPLFSNVTLAWPTEVATDEDVVAVIMEVTPSGFGLVLSMPPADETTPGNGSLIVNRGVQPFTVTSYGGTTIGSVAPGIGWQFWVTDNSTPAGTWGSVQYGAGVSNAAAGALAGAGIKAIGTTLNQSLPWTSLNASYTLVNADRARIFLWTGGGGVLTLPSPVTVGNDWYFQVRNQGTGSIALTPPAGPLINASASLNISPGDSATVGTDGVNYYTLGLGLAPEFVFDYVSIDLTGQASPYVLSGANLNRVSYRFGGTLTAPMQVVVPNTVQQYWVTNATTGAFTLTVKTAAGTGVQVVQGGAAILYSNGTNVLPAETAGLSFPIAVAQGGTGATTAPNALINLGGGTVGIAVFQSVTQAAARAAIGAGTGTGSVTSVDGSGGGTGLTLTGGPITTAGTLTLGGTLAVGSGGTGATTLTGIVKGNGAAAMTAVAAPTGALVGSNDVQTLTNKTIDLASNTLTGTLAQFNTACNNADFASLAGAETLTGKTINLASNAIPGTLAQFNANCTDADFAPTVNPTFGGTLTAGVISASGAIGGADITANRGDGTGVIFLGTTGHYVYWDGTNYIMPGGPLVVNGAQVLTTASGSAFLSSAQNVFVTDAGGNPRFYFAAGSTTYHISPTGHNFRINGSGGPDVMTIDTAGNVNCSGNISANIVVANLLQSNGNISATAGTVEAINTTATGQAYGGSVVSGGNGVNLSINNTPLLFTDTGGTHPKLICQDDNNFVFYGTNAAGGLRPLWSFGMRSDTAGMFVNTDITATGNVTAYSDARLKTNVFTIEDALLKVEEMRGVTFDRIDSGTPSSGVIAQELEEVAPELVATNDEGMKSVAYGNLVGYLIEAIKELSARVELLEADR